MPARSLRGRTAVVAGGSARLAAAIARRLLADGAGVLVAAHDAETALSLEGELAADGGAAYVLTADPARARDADALFGEALRVFGGLDVAVAIGASPEPARGDPFGLDDTGFERALLADLRPAFAVAQRAARLMSARGRGGSVVLVADPFTAGDAPGGPAVAAGSGALEALTRAMAAAGGGRGVRVNLVRAGSVGDDATPPAGTPATPEDVAAAVAFLAAPRASYVSGAVLPVGGAALPDGGGRETRAAVSAAPGATNAVLVAGGTRGIGLACCRAFLADGAGVVFCGTSEERVQAATSELEGLGGGPVAGYACDVADAAAVERLVNESLRLFGRLDVCVAAAGTGPWGPFDRLPSAAVERQLAVNVLGVHNVLVATGRVMREQGSGSLVTLGSISGIRADCDGATYCASKAAVHQLTRSFARELTPQGVRVNCVAPGWVDTDMNGGLRDDPEAMRATCAAIPLGRLAQPKEIAEVAVFLAGDEAAAISGAVVVADGGLTSG